jgi:hypothetical protein
MDKKPFRSARSEGTRPRIPRSMVTAFLLLIYLLLAIGIYIGLHSKVFGPEY